MGIDDVQVSRLLDRVRREVDEGLLPSCQLALGIDGEIVVHEAFGDAGIDTRYCIFSATKAFVAATFWQLISEGLVDITEPVTTYVPEFGSLGKEAITVEQVMLHTSGFPHAPMGPSAWGSSTSRRETFSTWRLNWEPGTRFEYHPTSAHWVLAEVIEAVTGNDFRDEVHNRVTKPLGLRRLLGLGSTEQDNIADLVLVGEHATADELDAAFGIRELPRTEVTDDVVVVFNQGATRELGMPGGGAFATARDIAVLYQALMHNTGGLWDPELLGDVTSRIRNNLPDPLGVPAARTLGLITAGDDNMSHLRGMGRTVSSRTFGHNGAGGQLAWADPATGLSLGYVTNGYDRHEVRRPRRDTAIASIAAQCAVPT